MTGNAPHITTPPWQIDPDSTARDYRVIGGMSKAPGGFLIAGEIACYEDAELIAAAPALAAEVERLRGVVDKMFREYEGCPACWMKPSDHPYEDCPELASAAVSR